MAITITTPDSGLLKHALYTGITAEPDFQGILDPNLRTNSLVFEQNPLNTEEIQAGHARLVMKEMADLFLTRGAVTRRQSEILINFSLWGDQIYPVGQARHLLNNFLLRFIPDMGNEQCFSGAYSQASAGPMFDSDADLYVSSLSWIFVISRKRNS